MSGWLLLGLPGAVFAGGLVEGIWILSGLVLGAYLNWLIVAPRLPLYTERLDAVTLPTYLYKWSMVFIGIFKLHSVS